MKFSSVSQRLAFWFVMVTLLPMLLIGYGMQAVFERELKQTLVRQISSIADKKTDQVNYFLEERLRDAFTQTQSSAVQQAMQAFSQEFKRNGVNSASYRKLDAAYREYFQQFVSSSGFYDLFLISPQGNVVYSQTHEADFATNLFTGPYRNSGLAKASRNAFATLQGDFSEYELYAPSANAVAAFIAEPVMRNGKVLGVLALQIDNVGVFKAILDKTGLGMSGETVLARLENKQAALALVPLDIDPNAALKHVISLTDLHRGVPLVRALHGERGAGFEVDYGGEQVVAAWRYLPRLRAGMVVKMDAPEVLAPLYTVRLVGLVFICLALGLAVLAAFLLGRRLVQPLQALSHAATRFAEGKLEQRVEIVRQDEIGQLARSFNAMAANLQSLYEHLEEQIALRTNEIQKNVESLRIKDAAMSSSINAIAIAGMDGKMFYVNQAFLDLWQLPDREQVIGHSPLEFWERPEEAQQVMNALQQQGYWTGELAARLHDGSRATLQVSANMVRDDKAQPLCMLASFVDITARKHAEQALQNSKALLDSMISNMPTMVFVKRASDLRFEKLNHAGELLLGFSERELLGKNDYDFFPREQADFFTGNDREVLASHAMKDIPYESILTSNGETRILHTRKIGIYNAAGVATHLLGVSIDITEQIRAEEALHNSSERMKEAQRIAKVGSWELNLLTGKLEWSDEIFRLFEIDKDKFAATYDAFLHAIHPEDREQVNEAYTGSLKTRQPYQVSHRLLMADGRIKWVEERCETDFDAGGKPLVSRGTVQDVTRQKVAEKMLRESEARYSSVVTALAEGIVLYAKDGSVIAANKAAEQILGLTLEQMTGCLPIDLRWRAIREDGSVFPGEEYPGVVTLCTGKVMSDVIMGVLKPDGSLTWISISSQPIFHEGESMPSSAVESFADITERKNTEDLLKNSNEELERRVAQRTQLLREAKEEAEQANHSKSIFLTSMSHELRTPLNAILGYSQLMQLEPGMSQRDILDNAGEIRRAGDYLLNLVNDILDLARIESGRLELALDVVRLEEVMNECRSYQLKFAETHHVTLHLSDNCAVYRVIADYRAMVQVINNLVSNAIKYNRAGGRVNVSCSEHGHGRVRISVMDTGTGIAADKQAQLFQPFNRLGAEMGNIEGTGIGLVISRKLVEAMQGAIGMESVQGLGSTFWVDLPLAQEIHSGETAAPAAARKHPRILVAEDYVPNQNVLLLQLQTMGCEVEVAADGELALNMWRNKPYDMILTDIDMPVMNGMELAQILRKEERARGSSRIPIVAITATNIRTEIQRYKAAGIDEILNKPLSMDALRDALAGWFGDIAAKPVRSHAAKAKISPDKRAQDAILDINYLYHILGQVNLAQARILVDTFIRTANEGLKMAGTASENPALVAKEMHKQKSSARTVGALRYANLAALLEQQTKDVQFRGIAAALQGLRKALSEVESAAASLLETRGKSSAVLAPSNNIAQVACHSALVVDDDLVVLQQVKTMLETLGVRQILTAENGVEAIKVLSAHKSEVEVLLCDLSMPEMDGVELIRQFGKTGFKGGLILISGAEEKIISTVNKLAVLQGLRVLGQLQKPVSAAQLALLLAHTADLPAQQQQAAARQAVSKNAISAAMAANEFSIWFQPKVNADTLQVVGLEALARWQLPNGQFIPPDNFIMAAEREGIIGELSQILVSIALSEAARLFAAGYPLKVSINLSGAWLNDLSLPDFVLSKTKSAGLSASDVILEVTETGVMEDLTTALDVLSRLRLKGFGLSIDDFGIGYSSFEQLGRIPFTEMKLDRSFVCKGAEDAAARAILESSMDMAHKLKLSTVAEGVETEQDLKLVRSLGCDLVQGYLIAKPMPLMDLLLWLDKQKRSKS